MSLPVIHLDRPNQFAFTGWSGEAVNFAGLPSAATVDGQFWMVLNASGSRFLFTYKASGLYLSESGSWRKINNAQLLLNDDQFSVYNAIDNTKQITFDVSAISTATKRTATWPNKDGTIAMLSDITSGGFTDYSNIDTTNIITFSTVGVTHSNLVVNGLDNAKTYYAEAFVIWSHDASNTDAFFEFRNFASNILSERITIEPQDSGGGGAGGTNQRIDLTMRGEVTPTAGSVQLDIFFGTSDNGDETTIYEAQIYLREKQ